MKKKVYKFLLFLVILVLCFIVAVYWFTKQPPFGQEPTGERLAQIKQSPHYVGDQFQNLVPLPILAEGESSASIFVEDFFAPKTQTVPTKPIPTIKTDLRALDKNTDVVIWLGHSSFYIQLAGKRILLDPVLSPYASPLSFINKAFDGTSIYNVDDIPEIDYVLISHDHWDHLDYPTVSKLMNKIDNVIIPLGIGSHFERWGYPKEKLHEADWYGKFEFADHLTIHVLPAQHYSGRGLTNNKTLWASFALETPTKRIYFGGDSGYGAHFKEIASQLGGFDLVLLDSGQYDPRWASIHMNPEEALQAAQDLQAKAFMPIHVGKFSISMHAWNEPFKRIIQKSADEPFEIVTPIIGQTVWLNNLQGQHFTHWWESLDN